MSDKWLLRVAYLLPIAGLILAFLYYGTNGDLSSDSNLYLFVGNNFWKGEGLLQIDGNFFAAHGPIFPLLYSALHSAAGKEIIQVLVFLALGFSFLLGIYLAERIFSARAALFAALLFLATPFFWIELDKGSIDYLQLLLMSLFLLALLKPTRERFAVAGFVFALMLLSKETMALSIFVPLAWLGARPASFVMRRYFIFLATAFLAAAWWWLVVFHEAGVFFPAQQLEHAFGLNERSPLEIIFPALSLLAIIPFIYFYRKDPRARMVLLLLLASIPPSLLAFVNNMDERQFVVFSFFASLMLAGVIDRGLYMIRKENLAFVASLLPLLLLLLFPITLSAQNTSGERQGEPYLTGVLKEKIGKNGQAMVLLHNNKVADVRVLAQKSEVAFFQETDLSNCPCSLRSFQENGFWKKLTRSDFLLILDDARLFMQTKKTPGLELLWKNPKEASALFIVKRKALPEKSFFYKRYLNGSVFNYSAKDRSRYSS